MEWTSSCSLPICGSLREDTALYIDDKGQESKGKIPRHGLVRKKEFELVEQTDNSVTLQLKTMRIVIKLPLIISA